MILILSSKLFNWDIWINHWWICIAQYSLTHVSWCLRDAAVHKGWFVKTHISTYVSAFDFIGMPMRLEYLQLFRFTYKLNVCKRVPFTFLPMFEKSFGWVLVLLLGLRILWNLERSLTSLVKVRDLLVWNRLQVLIKYVVMKFWQLNLQLNFLLFYVILLHYHSFIPLSCRKAFSV